jgi:hypothetical protein
MLSSHFLVTSVTLLMMSRLSYCRNSRLWIKKGPEIVNLLDNFCLFKIESIAAKLPSKPGQETLYMFTEKYRFHVNLESHKLVDADYERMIPDGADVLCNMISNGKVYTLYNNNNQMTIQEDNPQTEQSLTYVSSAVSATLSQTNPDRFSFSSEPN